MEVGQVGFKDEKEVFINALFLPNKHGSIFKNVSKLLFIFLH
jgi:hypothetical protein